MSRRRKKKSVNTMVAVQPNPRSENITLVKAEMLKNGDTETVKHTRGRKSYVQIAIEQDLYELIKASIGEFSENNPNASPKDLYEFLQPKYSSVFTDENMDDSNFKQKIDMDTGWKKAWYGRKAVKTKSLLDQKIFDIVSDKNTKPETIISAYDKYMKYALAEKELNSSNEDEEDTIIFGFRGDE